MSVSTNLLLALPVIALACGPTTVPLDGSTEGTSSTCQTSVVPTTCSLTGDPTSSAESSTSEVTTGTANSTSNFGTSTEEGAASECDVLGQSCREGEKCVPFANSEGVWNFSTCVPVVGDGAAGEPCDAQGETGIDDCAAGTLCWNRDPQGHGICVGLCTGSMMAPTCEDGFACAIHSVTLFLCLPLCNPLIQDCGAGENCVEDTDSFVCIPDVSGTNGKANDPCDSYGDCDPGLLCRGSNEVSKACGPDEIACCTPFCSLAQADCPNPDQSCAAWYAEGEAPPGQEELGLCQIDPG